ncbi:conserved hypothetical protein [Cupriavidus taiwanensis]|nr:conserved hypothetical protein [Cupriavidus taiwanensis]SOY96446.1 conserved hypothetical protein [Cupriavidus taiwanensis]
MNESPCPSNEAVMRASCLPAFRATRRSMFAPDSLMTRAQRCRLAAAMMHSLNFQVSPKTPRSMENDSYIYFDVLQSLARRTDAITAECGCSAPSLDAWTSVPVSFPEQQLRAVGTLVQDLYSEPRFEEFHPAKTNIWSADAPIAPLYYPYNRCTVWECGSCRRVYLRYVEGGGYFVDPRIRRLSDGVLVDVALPD